MLATFLGPVGDAYRDQIIDSGDQPGFLLLVGFLLSFGFIRMSTRLMRSPKVPWWPGSVKPGGLHIHHLVFGIVLMLLAGFLEFALLPGSPWVELFAAAFGVGAGLTIDEFALWLHLEDVYWSDEGRSSVDAFVVACIIGILVFVGIAPFKDDWNGADVFASLLSIALSLLVITACLAKGKVFMALVGIFIPPVAVVGAIRLARPRSPWARRRYHEGSRKREKSETREQRWAARKMRWRDAIGGAPSLDGPKEKDRV
jgi:lysyl-tRNA synthetase, class II